MRVLTALTYYRPHYSGLTIYTERVARALVERGHQVTVLTSQFSEDLPEHEISEGVEIFRPKVWFHVSKGVLMPSMPVWAWRLIRQADVVHLHVPQFDAWHIGLLSRFLDKPVVLTYHCDLHLPAGTVHSIANRVSDMANHIAARTANVIVHNTLDYAENSPFLHRYLSKLQPVFPPVVVEKVDKLDLYKFQYRYNIQPEQRIIGMAARLASEKGVEYLAQALPLIMEEFPKTRVLFIGPYQNVVGEEDYARRVFSLIEPLGNHWTFLGTASPKEMASFYHKSDVLVLPSINSTESYGMVQVEAMACGVPVVASDLPGVRVPVTETGAGLVIPPADIESLANAVVAILKDPSQFRGRPEKLIQQSTPENVAMEYERIYAMVLGDASLGNPQRMIADEKTDTIEDLGIIDKP